MICILAVIGGLWLFFTLLGFLNDWWNRPMSSEEFQRWREKR